MTHRRVLAALLGAAALANGGCGDDDSGGASTAPTSTGDTAAIERQLDVSTDLERKPAVPKLPDLPPEQLVTKDVVEGTGAAATAGDKVTVEYVGYSYSTDKEFDSSWGREPFEATLESPGVIEGWTKGIPGMKEGGRRVLVIPPDLAYGEEGQPPDIAPYETLVFVIDLKKVA